MGGAPSSHILKPASARLPEIVLNEFLCMRFAAALGLSIPAIELALIDNCDAHGKNFSLLYRKEALELAPFYDLVSTTFWPELDMKLSMRFGKEYRINEVGPDDLEAFADDISVKPLVVRNRVRSLVEYAPGAWEQVRALPVAANAAPIMERIWEGWRMRASRVNSA